MKSYSVRMQFSKRRNSEQNKCKPLILLKTLVRSKVVLEVFYICEMDAWVNLRLTRFFKKVINVQIIKARGSRCLIFDLQYNSITRRKLTMSLNQSTKALIFRGTCRILCVGSKKYSREDIKGDSYIKLKG